MPEPPPGEGRCRVGSAPAPDARRGKDCVAGKAEAPRQQHDVLLSEQGLEMQVLMVGASSGSGEAPSAATRLPRGPAGGGTWGAGTPPRHLGVRHRAQPTAVMATGAGRTACSVAMGVSSPGTEPLGFAWVKPRGSGAREGLGPAGICGMAGPRVLPLPRLFGEPRPGHLPLSVGRCWSGTGGPPKAAGSGPGAGVGARDRTGSIPGGRPENGEVGCAVLPCQSWGNRGTSRETLPQPPPRRSLWREGRARGR